MSIWQIARWELDSAFDIERLTVAGMRLVVAALISAAIGWERERHDADAGLRTHILIGMGATLLVIAADHAQLGADGMSRILQGLLAGIGLLAAGSVLKSDDRDRIRGLTTAATTWIVAGMGVVVGLGQYGTAIVAALLTLIVLTLVKRLKRRIENTSRD